MSIKITTRVWNSAPFKSYTLIVLLALADFADDEGLCWPKVETIQKRTRCARRSVYQALKTLVEEGWIEKPEGNDSKIHMYRVTPPLIDPGAGDRMLYKPSRRKGFQVSDSGQCAPIAPGEGEVSAPAAQSRAPIAQSSAPIALPPHPLIGRTVIEPSMIPFALSELQSGTLDGDARHAACKNVCEQYAGHKGVTFMWDGSEGRALASLLKAAPTLTAEVFAECVRHRARSEVSHGERPRIWLVTLLKYQGAPLDRFGVPRGDSDATGREGSTSGRSDGNRAQRRTNSNIDAARRARG